MMNTVFLRKHNRLAGLIETAHPEWDDKRVFQTARNTVIVAFIKIVVKTYINHISPLPFTLRADPSVAWDAHWNKPNWITTEFSLLYRWHALIPDQITWNETAIPVGKTFMDNKLLTNQGLLASFTQMSTQQAAELGPGNTASPLLQIEIDSTKQGRLCTLASYSGYCDYLGINRPYSMDAISSDPEVAALLRGFYAPPRRGFSRGAVLRKPRTQQPFARPDPVVRSARCVQSGTDQPVAVAGGVQTHHILGCRMGCDRLNQPPAGRGGPQCFGRRR